VLASARGVVNEVVWKVTLLEDKHAIVCQAWDMAELELLGLADADWRQEEVERYCVALAEELTILQIRGSELCLVIVAPPPPEVGSPA
jgi:hypothetical protein